MNDKQRWSMKCDSHTYITLFYDDKFIRCYDNDYFNENEKNNNYYMEYVIEKIEKRTGLKITDINIIGDVEDFDGLRFLNGGFKKGREWLTIPEEESK